MMMKRKKLPKWFFGGISVWLVVVLGFGIYWGVSIRPKGDAFWKRIEMVKSVTGASVDEDGRVISMDGSEAGWIFSLIQASESYEPDHPDGRSRVFTFDTDAGDVTLVLMETSDQGVVIQSFSGGSEGWNYGTRRSDELVELLADDAPAGEKMRFVR